MKKITTFLTGFACIILFVFFIAAQGSCNKDTSTPNAPTVTTSITGLWEGTMTEPTHSQPFFLSLKTNGTCTLENISPGTQENFCFGTWVLSGSTLNCNMKCVYGYPSNVNLQMTYTGVFDSSAATIKGSYHLAHPSGVSTDGVFQLVKAK